MVVLAILLFGSLARGERSIGSDVDVLFVEDGGEVAHTGRRRMTIFHYPWRKLLDAAASGDLFACHLAFEAKPIHDPERLLSRLREAFAFKADYGEEVSHATDLGWFLVRHGRGLDRGLVAKRTIWSVRTILIARSAEERRPMFSPGALAEGSGSDAARELLLRRHDRSADAAMGARLEAFLVERNLVERFHLRATFDEFVARFESTGNGTALQTANRLVALAAAYR